MLINITITDYTYNFVARLSACIGSAAIDLLNHFILRRPFSRELESGLMRELAWYLFRLYVPTVLNDGEKKSLSQRNGSLLWFRLEIINFEPKPRKLLC